MLPTQLWEQEITLGKEHNENSSVPKSPSFLGKQSLLLRPAGDNVEISGGASTTVKCQCILEVVQAGWETDAPYVKVPTSIAQPPTHTEITKFSTNQGDQEGRRILYQKTTGRNFRDELGPDIYFQMTKLRNTEIF